MVEIDLSEATEESGAGQATPEQLREWRSEAEFYEMSLRATIVTSPSQRFYVFANDTYTEGSAVFGTSINISHDSLQSFSSIHEIQGSAKLSRSGWLDFIKVMSEQMEFRDEELAAAGFFRLAKSDE